MEERDFKRTLALGRLLLQLAPEYPLARRAVADLGNALAVEARRAQDIGGQMVLNAQAGECARLLEAHPAPGAAAPGPGIPTPELVAKRARDPIHRMKLTPEQRRAASEIRAVAEAVAADGFDATSPLHPDRMATAGTGRSAPDILELIKGEAAEAVRARFGPWAREAAGRAAYRGTNGAAAGPSIFDVTWRVVVGQEGCRALDSEYRVRKETTAAVVRAALELYGRVGGWV